MTTDHGPLDDDDVFTGAAAERTFLAWTRTAFALIAGGFAVGRVRSLPIHGPIGVGLAVAGLTFWALAGAQYRRDIRRLRAGTFSVSVLAIRAMTALTLAGACAAFVAALRAP